MGLGIRLATRPSSTGSDPIIKTVGMAVVAPFAGNAAGLPAATSTATRR
jgi:hypothetical protein